MDASKPTEGGNRMWWLSTDDKPEGPFPEDSIRERLGARQIPPAALVCPVGGQEWKPIGEWPEFAGAVEPARRMAMPQATADAAKPVLTNPSLPSMANWICVYAILVSPFLWFVQNFSCCITFSCPFQEGSGFEMAFLALEAFDSLLALGVVILLFVGGIRLRSLRRSGASISKVAIYSSLGRVVLFMLCGAVLGGIAGAKGCLADTTSSTTAQELISFASVIVYLAEFAFQIIALVWLHRNARSLPFTEK